MITLKINVSMKNERKHGHTKKDPKRGQRGWDGE
jgi:hypothetical protein